MDKKNELALNVLAAYKTRAENDVALLKASIEATKNNLESSLDMLEFREKELKQIAASIKKLGA